MKTLITSFMGLLPTVGCDSMNCPRKVYKNLEDMTDGTFIHLCRKHYISWRKEGYPMREIK